MKALHALASFALVATALAAPTRLRDTDLVATAGADARLSTLASLIKKAGLESTFRGAGPYTLFAPTNEAFAKLPKVTLDRLNAEPETLKKVLTYHVIEAKVMAADLKTMKTATVEGEEIAIRVPKPKADAASSATAKKPRGPHIGNAGIIQADISASNGVVHVINRVLLPPSLNLVGAPAKKGGGKKGGGKKNGTPPTGSPSTTGGGTTGGGTTGGGL